MILLAGGLGFIGSNVAIELLKENYAVLILDDLSNSDISCLDNLYHLCDSYKINKNLLVFEQVDLTDYNKVENIFSRYGIKHIINLAGKKAVTESIQMPNEYYWININIHLNLVRLAEKFCAHSYIFSSSATVYGTSKSPLNEDSETGKGITNPYGWTKYMIEIMIKDLARVSDIKFVILRYFNPVGSDKSNTLGENPKNIPNNLMPVLLSKLASDSELNIFGNDYETKDGTCIRDFIHVNDLARGHVKALQYIKNSMSTSLEVFNLGSGSGYTVLELVKKFIEINKVSLRYKISERREGDLDRCWADTSRAREILGWEATKTLEEICSDSYKYYIKK
jgi:UDP-glucose 4-epimerase